MSAEENEIVKTLLSTEIFDGKSINKIFAELYSLVIAEDVQIKESITALSAALTGDDKSQSEALFGFIAPVIKDFVGESIKNKKLLIDMVNSIQKLMMIAYKDSSEEATNDKLLSDTEREQLLSNISIIKSDAVQIQKTIDAGMEKVNDKIRSSSD